MLYKLLIRLVIVSLSLDKHTMAQVRIQLSKLMAALLYTAWDVLKEARFCQQHENTSVNKLAVELHNMVSLNCIQYPCALRMLQMKIRSQFAYCMPQPSVDSKIPVILTPWVLIDSYTLVLQVCIPMAEKHFGGGGNLGGCWPPEMYSGYMQYFNSCTDQSSHVSTKKKSSKITKMKVRITHMKF